MNNFTRWELFLVKRIILIRRYNSSKANWTIPYARKKLDFIPHALAPILEVNAPVYFVSKMQIYIRKLVKK